MYNILTIIPARGGSKRIPNKNSKLLAGHPLVAYSIMAALNAQTSSRVIVSTDSKDIATISQRYGAEVPFLRPEEISQDMSTDWEAFHQALQWFDEQENYQPDIIVHLRPTTPLRPPDMVDTAIQLIQTNQNADSLRSIVASPLTPYKMWRYADDGFLKPVVTIPDVEEAYNLPTQQLPKAYLHSGHIDVIRRKTIINGSMTGKRILPLMVDEAYYVDIDYPADWTRAEHLLATFKRPRVNVDDDHLTQ